MMDINVWGVLCAMKYEIPEMLKNPDQTGRGSIVNTSSIAGLIGFRSIPLYVASKHAVNGLTKSFALEFTKQNIQVNSVCPGFVETPMVDRITEQAPKALLEQLTPLGRIGKPEEVASLITFLLDSKNGYITGSCFPIDGGYTAQ
jgi:NAD(P)-dependent dehydrogenase (short-subunit alcohol dehydrogenase family)